MCWCSCPHSSCVSTLVVGEVERDAASGQLMAVLKGAVPVLAQALCRQSQFCLGVCAVSSGALQPSVVLGSDPRASIRWFFTSAASVPVLVVVWVSSLQGLVHDPWGWSRFTASIP